MVRRGKIKFVEKDIRSIDENGATNSMPVVHKHEFVFIVIKCLEVNKLNMYGTLAYCSLAYKSQLIICSINATHNQLFRLLNA